ncbi:MAG: putative type restriction endonuclease [Acidimicrobiales bacterium]|nr:putative type restriction endonuclease [Acidimicrobiales bacterium]
MLSPLLEWLREQTAGWRPSVVGVFREDALHEWPLIASSASDLRRQLTEHGHLLPLPSEPAALANVMEIELRQHLAEAAALTPGAEVAAGTERSYPDLELSGDAFGGGFRAVDIKCARRKISPSGRTPTTLSNRIALYTGNTYFLWPQLKFGGIMRPFEQYEELISIVVIYTYRPELPQRIADVQVVVHETWRLASRGRASATREYIGSVRQIEQLLAGTGDFETADDFYAYWRHSTRNWKKSPEAEKLLRQALGRRSPPPA